MKFFYFEIPFLKNEQVILSKRKKCKFFQICAINK
jgi:hypothetical protein